MIITQSPLRISLLGGGTDFSHFFRQEEGCVLSAAIDKYIYVTIKERYDDRIRIGYTKTELVDSVDEIEHELVRECLRRTGIHRRVEISTMADIPSEGSGLGSSSTVTVGLLNAMYTYLGQAKEAETLAREACEIEINILGKPIGVQDQYITAYGGLRFLRFCRNGGVEVRSLALPENLVRRLNQNLMLFFTGITRKSETVLSEQVHNIDERLDILRLMKVMAMQGMESLLAGELDEIGYLLHQSWLCKRQLASRISNQAIDDLYQTARQAGALGGKIAGAGGGGYLLLYCPRAKQEDVRAALSRLPELSFHLERDGSKVILNYRR